jgi:hypothetical protein
LKIQRSKALKVGLCWAVETLFSQYHKAQTRKCCPARVSTSIPRAKNPSRHFVPTSSRHPASLRPQTRRRAPSIPDSPTSPACRLYPEGPRLQTRNRLVAARWRRRSARSSSRAASPSAARTPRTPPRSSPRVSSHPFPRPSFTFSGSWSAFLSSCAHACAFGVCGFACSADLLHQLQDEPRGPRLQLGGLLPQQVSSHQTGVI